jgi:hypothetical protein
MDKDLIVCDFDIWDLIYRVDLLNLCVIERIKWQVWALA